MSSTSEKAFENPAAEERIAGAYYQALARTYIAEPYDPASLRPLRREVRRCLRVLRRTYEHLLVSGSGEQDDQPMAGTAREWLLDNYHLLAREGEGVLDGLKTSDRLPAENRRPAVFSLCLKLAEEKGIPDREGWDELMEAARQHRPLTVFELDQLSLCLRAALIVLAARACRPTGDGFPPEGEEAARRLSRAVNGLRTAADIDFAGLTERHSIVERILSDDPSGIYSRMDELSRAGYRRRVAALAQRERISEASVAASLVEKASQAAALPGQHVGAYLPDDREKRRWRGRTLLLAEALLPAAVSLTLAVWLQAPAAALLLYLPLWEILRPLLEHVVLKHLPPLRLPRLELEGVIPEEGRTVIAVSTLLPPAAKAGETAARLARLYNGNGQGAVQVCLLADLRGADYPSLPRDSADINAMEREIRRLNQRMGNAFVLAVRPREYSETMRSYTGRERKRGAIAELTRFICGGENRFLSFVGDGQALRRARYLIALDADTGMLMDTAARLVGVALHPLNQPVWDEKRGRVSQGYGVLTPRMSPELVSAGRTPFSSAMAGAGGVTPYDVPAGELYMDGFASGIFAGKGLIDLRAFERTLQTPFPPEQVLSHDILEGCLLRAGLVGDVEMTDGVPDRMGSWLTRLHRWVRGDWQNAPFLFNRLLPLRRLDKWKLLDNLRRSLTPAAALLCLLLSPLFAGTAGQVLAAAALLSAMAGEVLAALLSLLHGGMLTLTGRYYSRTLPRALSAFTRAAYQLVMLPAQAWTGADAAARALWRLKSRRRLLQWVTAADAEGGRNTLGLALRRFWYVLPAAALLILTGAGLTRLAGILFLLLIPLALFSGRPPKVLERRALSPAEKERVSAYAAAMWRFYEELCGAEDHYLPPDNLQESPVWRVAHRTSPTNIGMYLLCIAAARDFGFIDNEGFLLRTERTVRTLERLEKWKGNLYNWYDTRTLHPLSPRYISTVDSGNLACCLVALRQAVLELSEGSSSPAFQLAERIRLLNEQLELAPLYNPRRALFHIGLDPDTGEVSPSYYDLLMSESRLTGYFAIATRAIPKKHWGALGRTLARSGRYVGPVSWTGTMFEYFMPRLLLPAQEGSMSDEALRFCLHCQRRRPPRGVPWGISESGFYAFDSNLSYQYKAHGVPRLALKRGLGSELVVSPYSTFLTLTTDPEAALRNLSRLERRGMTGRCGFYEAADFTPDRTPRGGFSIVRSYMAHHVGMSMVACANAAMEDRFVRLFLRDPAMARAEELLHERAPESGAVFSGAQERSVPERPGRSRPAAEEIPVINPRTPRMQLLSGSEWSLAVTDSGAGISVCRGLDIHMHSGDLLRRPQGIFTVVDGGEGAFSLTRAPDYGDGTTQRRAEFGEGYAAFFADRGALETGLRVMVHPRLPCEQRQVVLKNKSGRRLSVRVLFYFEPCLARREDAQAHPAFSRLFLSARRDEAAGALFLTRRGREGEPPVCLAVGLLDGGGFEYEVSREALLTRPEGIVSLTAGSGRPFSSRGRGIPDGAAAIRLTVELPPRSQRLVTLALTAAPTESEAATRLIEIRREGPLTVGRAARSPFGGVEAQLAAAILPDLFYPPRMSREWAAAARENTKGQTALWALGISGDFPLLFIEIHNAADASRAEPYMRLHRSLRLGGVSTELVIAFREGGDYDSPVLDGIREAARSARCDSLLGARGGIHPVNLSIHGEEALALLTAVCAHNGARDLQRAAPPPVDYVPVEIGPVEKPDGPAAGAHGELSVHGGRFASGDFTLEGEAPRLPWCHVLANPTFGTLVSDRAAGFSWAINARENRLTPWYNDTASDNRGEMLLLRTAGRVYDLLWGARVTFGEGFARYEGRAGALRVQVTIRVPRRGMLKLIELELENVGTLEEEEREVEAVYYTEPVLGVDRSAARHVASRWENGALYLRNPFAAVRGHMLLTALGGADDCDCDRGGFLSGKWGTGTLAPLPDPCAAVLVRRRLPPRRKERVTFVLGFAACEEAARRLPALAEELLREEAALVPAVTTPDRELNALCAWLPRQVVDCRIYARTGFYQSGGAWGFRDQLQDSLAALWINPALTRRQLLRCAAVQFEEGDVLHWWHRLPGRGPRGVRTRCSDDMVWLPYVLAEYVSFTGDRAFADTPVGWLRGEPLREDEGDRYFEPAAVEQRDSLYEHGARALERACTEGPHRLPLIGSGDWNDGFSQLGAGGQGESVWLGMFLALTLDRYARLAEERGDERRAALFRRAASGYREAAEACFDNDRYWRAFFDDGTPLGKKGDPACALDSLTQSFAVLSGLDPGRATAALDTARKELADEELGVVRLFTPPFDRPEKPVGYIAAYPPGVRENGGQYTHAAAWLAIAFLRSGRAEEGVQLLRLLNPVNKYAHSDASGGAWARYGGEPYVLAGDVYANEECPGRVGWTWYTGSAGWVYIAVLRELLGLIPQGDRLTLSPCLPAGWEGFTLSMILRGTRLQLTVRRAETARLLVDGKTAGWIPLDGGEHRAEVFFPANPPQAL
ncbi:MAG: hypothetical protein HFJ80_01635 [Clostridiales bacterium]|nr:hypothetical protein [Clostridiales bacterium]